MNKIKYLQGIINDSSLTFINKLDKVRSNRMDFSMLLLLLDEKDLFTQNFPLDEIKNDKNILDFYRDPDTDKMLFSCCIDSDEFLLNILEDYEFSKQINDITDNGILKRLNSLYRNVEFIQGLLDRNILKRYIEFGAASNVVFNQDLGVDYNIKLIDFMKENESFYTFEYLNGFDIDKDLKPYIYKFLKSKIDRSNIILFIDEYCDKNTVLDFLKFIDLDTLLFVIEYSFERETKLLDYDDIKADADLNLKLSNIELVSAYIINMIESDECRGLRMIHSLSECLNIEQLSTIIGKIFQVKGVAFILDLQETANENQLVINGFMNDEILNAIFCEKIKSGRYDLLEDLDLLPTMELNEKQLEDALFVFFTSSGHGEHFYDYEILDKVSNYVEVKENLANRIFQCGQKDLDLFVKLGLSSQWIAKQFGVDLFIKEMLENKEFDRLPDLISDNKVKIKEIMLQVIKNEHWHLDEYLKFSLSHELLESKEILKLVKKTDKSEIIEFLPANIINLLLKEKSVNSGLIVSPHLTSEQKTKLLHNMTIRDIIGWNGLIFKADLNADQLQYAWDKVKEESNKDLKAFMFTMIKIYSLKMNEGLLIDIKKRASKLKGYEDIVLSCIDDPFSDELNNQESGSLLNKRFTKDIANEEQAFKSLTNEDYLPIINEKNIKRIFNKLKDSGSWKKIEVLELVMNKKYPFDMVTANEDLLKVLIPTVSSPYGHFQHIAVKLLEMNISTAWKIEIVKTADHLDADHMDSDCIKQLPVELVNIIIEKRRVDSFIDNLTEDQILGVLNSNNSRKFVLVPLLNRVSNEEIILKLSDPQIFTNDQEAVSWNVAEYILNNFETFSEKFIESWLEKSKLDHKHWHWFQDDSNLRTVNKRLFIKKSLEVAKINHEFDHVDLILFMYNIDGFSTDDIRLLFSNKNERFLKNEEFNEAFDLLSDNYKTLIINSLLKKHSDIMGLNGKFIEHLDVIHPDQINGMFTRNVSQLFLQRYFINFSEKQLKKFRKAILEMDCISWNAFYSLTGTLGRYFMWSNIELDQMLDQLISDDDEARKFILKGTDIAFTSNTQNKIYKVLKKMINTGLDVGEIHYSFSLLLLNYPDLRTLYVEKTTSARGIVNLLNVGLKNQKENITNQEESILIDKIAKEFLRIPLDELSQEVQDRILPIIFNKLVANEAISFVNKDDGLYAYVHERVFSFTNNIELGSPFGANKYLTEENKNKIMKLCTRLNDFYPPEIPGYVEFGLDRSFIPEMKLESKIQELISGIKNFKSDLNTNDLVEGLIRFGNINKIKAVAKRVDSTNAEAIFEYEVFMIFDVNIIETKQRLYDKEVLQLMQKKEVELQAILEQNLNIDTDRTFGFELEFSTNRPKNQIKEKLMSTIGNEIHEVNVIDSYMSSSGKFWDLKVDSSVNPTLGFSIELASPILKGEPGIKESNTVLSTIFTEYQVDTSEAVSGGLHVHHDIKDLIEIESENSAILDKFHVFQESIYSLCKNYRNDNEYCSKISMQSIESGEKQNRTVGFNITPYKTMEFRMRESISDVGAILRWIKLTQQVVESAAIGLIEDHKKFQNKVHETLDLIQFEKALQVKKIEKNTMLIKELDRYNQARSFADLMMEEKLTKI